MSGGALDSRLVALAEAAELASGRLEEPVVAAAREVVARAGERLGHGIDATVVALAGPTGAGKSTLFNRLAGAELSRVGVRRPTSSSTTGAAGGDGHAPLLDWLEIGTRHPLGEDAPPGLVLLDLPDFDSVEVAHHEEVQRVVALADLLVWVVDPQKYADASLHERFLRPLSHHGAAMLAVLNQADLLRGRAEEAADDLRGLLSRSGLGDVPVLAMSARTGEGTDGLRDAIGARVQGREAALARLAADVGAAAARMRDGAGDGEPAGIGRGDRRQLAAELGAAAGTPAVIAAVAAAHRRRGALATGTPWASWLRRLRPDPLRRLGIGDHPREEVRTSLPRATPIQRAQLDSAIRSLAGDAAEGAGPPWPALARTAATRHEEELADRLDRAIAGADLRLRPPRWWTPVRFLQRALALVAAAGALWLVALAALGYLQLDEAVATPDAWGIPMPTLLLAGGLLAGLLVTLLARLLNGAGARRRQARARRALHERIDEVARGLVLAPLEAELATRERLLAALGAAEGAGGASARRRRPAPA